MLGKLTKVSINQNETKAESIWLERERPMPLH